MLMPGNEMELYNPNRISKTSTDIVNHKEIHLYNSNSGRALSL
jgi:hypothetical protein